MLLHRSPALTAIYNEIKNSERNRVLDLGPMSKGCFQLFSELSCKIQVEDLAGYMRDSIASGESLSDTDIEAELTNYADNDRFDVILAWDLFNYLNLDQIQTLFARLKPYCKPNTLIYMLRYVEKRIPETPREFSVKDKYLLELSEGELNARAVPVLSTLQLLSAMPGYFMQDTLVGQTGMLPGITEHVLRFSANEDTKHLISKSETPKLRENGPLPSPEQNKVHLSPSVAEVVSLLQSDNNCRVLDLASSANRTADCIVDQAGAYYRVDLFSLLERSRAKGEEFLNLEVLKHKFTDKFDVILAWDLFNFCSPAQMKQLDSALAALSHNETFLLAFMYIGRSQYSLPSAFRVLNGSKVHILPSSKKIDAPVHAITGASLLRLLSNYDMDKTYAYRTGMDRDIIEYIFASRAASNVSELREII